MALILEIDVDEKGLVRGVKNVKGELTHLDNNASRASKNVGMSFDKMKLGILAATAAVGVAVSKVSGWINETTTYMDKIAKMSKATGISTESLSALGYAAELSGSNLDAISIGVKRLARNMSDAKDGLGEAKRTFDKLGLSVSDNNGKFKTLDSMLFEIADKFKYTEDATAKAAMAQELFGRSGADLIPLLNEGAEGLKKYYTEAERLGKTFSAEEAAKAEAYKDAITNLTAAFDGLKMKLVTSGLVDNLTLLFNMISGTKKVRPVKLVAEEDKKRLEDILSLYDQGKVSQIDWNNLKKEFTELELKYAGINIKNHEINRDKLTAEIQWNQELIDIEVDKEKARQKEIEDKIRLAEQQAKALEDAERLKNLMAEIAEIEALASTERHGAYQQTSQDITDLEATAEEQKWDEEWLNNLESSNDEAVKLRNNTKSLGDQAKATGLMMANYMVDTLASCVGHADRLEDSLKNIGDMILQTAISFGIKALGASIGIPFFQHGGTFKVGGTGGPDSQLVAFRATPGETVSVSPNPTYNTNTNNMNLNFNFAKSSDVDEWVIKNQIIPAIRKEIMQRGAVLS